eukprot:GDKJ01018811.1.p2 GENE.GDKJ01018811.1~~GDKJ01018811.1.p2  ORF type:complete len:302 (-),score=47.23 GDKJ01018811.1:91-996(-)
MTLPPTAFGGSALGGQNPTGGDANGTFAFGGNILRFISQSALGGNAASINATSPFSLVTGGSVWDGASDNVQGGSVDAINLNDFSNLLASGGNTFGIYSNTLNGGAANVLSLSSNSSTYAVAGNSLGILVENVFGGNILGRLTGANSTLGILGGSVLGALNTKSEGGNAEASAEIGRVVSSGGNNLGLFYGEGQAGKAMVTCSDDPDCSGISFAGSSFALGNTTQTGGASESSGSGSNIRRGLQLFFNATEEILAYFPLFIDMTRSNSNSNKNSNENSAPGSVTETHNTSNANARRLRTRD